MEGATWVCDDALEDHVWVSELTISRQEAEVSGGSQLRHRGPLRCPVENAVVFVSNKT